MKRLRSVVTVPYLTVPICYRVQNYTLYVYRGVGITLTQVSGITPAPLAEGRKADMLTTSEVNKLFDLLKELHGKDKSRDKRTIAIWLKVLEPWTYQQVRAAAIERARGGNRYYPDPAEISQFLPDPGVPAPQPVGSQDAKAKEAQDRLFARMKAERDRLIPLRRAAGLPATMEEAKAAGMTSGEWWNALETAGLNYPDSVWREEAVADGTA